MSEQLTLPSSASDTSTTTQPGRNNRVPLAVAGCSWSTRRWRELVHGSLRQLEHGSLVVCDAHGEERFGSGQNSDLIAAVVVHNESFYRRVALGGSIGAAESFMDGDWSTDDLTAVVRLMIRNSGATGQLERWSNFLRQPWLRLQHWLRRNHLLNSRRNIAAHYDLGNDFYSLWLDPSLAYSSAVFEPPEISLHEAQNVKFERLCQKLRLQPQDHLLEIGCGWGGLALHAARNYGCRVTATTISAEQAKYVRAMIDEAGLVDRITLLTQDYRQLTGQFDKLVSVEMIEAVGQEYLREYFRTCARLLAPGGLMALQGITIADRLYPAYCQNVDFIQKYIFPGGHLPAPGRMLQQISDSTDLKVDHLEDLAQHYAETLARWRNNFHRVTNELSRQGISRRFRLMWEFYFCYCEAGFRERQLGLLQLTLCKP